MKCGKERKEDLPNYFLEPKGVNRYPFVDDVDREWIVVNYGFVLDGVEGQEVVDGYQRLRLTSGEQRR